MGLDWRQLAWSVLAITIVASTCGVLVFRRGVARNRGFVVLCVCAAIALVSWTHFGDLHSIYVDNEPGELGPRRAKTERHQPLQFHEFFHYYIGAKYFGQLGYSGLYDCTALADREIADEDKTPPRVGAWVRDLDDVLTDNATAVALQRCRDGARTHFTDARWASFKHDIRELARLAPDGWWNDLIYDAGFNPPPSWVVTGGAVANVIPIRVGTFPSYLVSTSLDVALLVLCFWGLRRSFGWTAAVLAATYFGASFISSYMWNGGAFLRFTWLTAVVLALCALKKERWMLAGALLGVATCDRLFPAGFAVGAMLPVALRMRDSIPDRVIFKRFAIGFASTVSVLVLASLVVFGADAWRVFFMRILRHGDIYYTMHIGLKKVLTYRDWVPSQNFMGHDGLATFQHWNIRLRDTWSSARPWAVPIQLAFVAATSFAARRRPTYEAALLWGVMFMFVFNIPANYYYVVLVIVPALLYRAAALATNEAERFRSYIALSAFNAFWMLTLIASRLSNDVLVYNFYICVTFTVMLCVWIGAWISDAMPGSIARAPRYR
jgi:hypothetical protein